MELSNGHQLACLVYLTVRILFIGPPGGPVSSVSVKEFGVISE